MSPNKKVIKKIKPIENHLCWDCSKAADGSCAIYDRITTIIEENFEVAKILFTVEECEKFLPDDPKEKDTEFIF